MASLNLNASQAEGRGSRPVVRFGKGLQTGDFRGWRLGLPTQKGPRKVPKRPRRKRVRDVPRPMLGDAPGGMTGRGEGTNFVVCLKAAADGRSASSANRVQPWAPSLCAGDAEHAELRGGLVVVVVPSACHGRLAETAALMGLRTSARAWAGLPGSGDEAVAGRLPSRVGTYGSPTGTWSSAGRPPEIGRSSGVAAWPRPLSARRWPHRPDGHAPFTCA